MTDDSYIERRFIVGSMSSTDLAERFVALVDVEDFEDGRAASAWRAFTAAVDAFAPDPASRVLAAVGPDVSAWLLEGIDVAIDADSERAVIFARAAAVRLFARRRRMRAVMKRAA